MRGTKLMQFGWAFALLCCGSTFCEEVERNFAVEPAPNVSIYNKKGSVTIVGWDEPQIRITGTIGNDITELKVEDDPSDPEIEVVSTKWSSSAAEARLTIYVPKASSLDVETVSASIDVSGVSGETLELRSTSGSIDAESAFSEVDVECVSGSIELTNAAGEVSVTNVSGNVKVKGSVESLSIESVSGGVETDVTADSVNAESVSGTMRLGVVGASEVWGESVSGGIRFLGSLATDGEMELHVLSGEITVGFSSPAHGEYELSTFSGSIDCDLEPLSNLQRDGKHMEFEFGDGDSSVDLESFSGSISVR